MQSYTAIIQERCILIVFSCFRSKDGDTSLTQSPKSRGFRLFQSGGGGVANGGATADTGTGTLSKDAIMSRVGQRYAKSSTSLNLAKMSSFKLNMA